MMPLKHILRNKLLLQKNFNLQEISIDMWPFWMFEENLKIANEIIEEEDEKRKLQEEEQRNNMPNIDSKSMIDNIKNVSNSFPRL